MNEMSWGMCALVSTLWKRNQDVTHNKGGDERMSDQGQTEEASRCAKVLNNGR